MPIVATNLTQTQTVKSVPKLHTDWNTAILPGKYSSTDGDNAPVSGSVSGEVYRLSEFVVVQIVYAVVSGNIKVYRRYSQNVSSVLTFVNDWSEVVGSGGGGGSTYNLSFLANSKAVGTVPWLLGSINLKEGIYAPPYALIGAGDPVYSATLKIQKPTGDVLSTLGGTSGGLDWRIADTGFTLLIPTYVEFLLTCNVENQPAFLRGLYLVAV